MIRLLLSLLLFCQFIHFGFGQHQAIYLLDLNNSGSSKVTFLTADNKAGQNKFLSAADKNNFELLRTTKQGYSAAFKCNLLNREKNEMPHSQNIIDLDDKYNSYVIWEEDKYHIVIKENGKFERVTSTSSKIVKHLWGNSDIVYVLTESLPGKFHLKRYQRSTNSFKTISVNAGGSICRANDNDFLYYMDIFSSDYKYIKEYNPEAYKSHIIIKIPNHVKTFTKSQDDHFYIIDGQEIKSWHEDKPLTWNVVSKLPFVNSGKQLMLYAPERGTDVLFLETW